MEVVAAAAVVVGVVLDEEHAEADLELGWVEESHEDEEDLALAPAGYPLPVLVKSPILDSPDFFPISRGAIDFLDA